MGHKKHILETRTVPGAAWVEQASCDSADEARTIARVRFPALVEEVANVAPYEVRVRIRECGLDVGEECEIRAKNGGVLGSVSRPENADHYTAHWGLNKAKQQRFATFEEACEHVRARGEYVNP